MKIQTISELETKKRIKNQRTKDPESQRVKSESPRDLARASARESMRASGIKK